MSKQRRLVSASSARRDWPTLGKRLLALVLFILMLGLLVALTRSLDWQELLATLRGYRTSTLLLAVAIAFASYALYSCFDLIGRAYTRHRLPLWQVLPVTFVCYAFSLNLGAWIGSIALRFRLYSQLGLRPSVITKVLTLSLMTNWLGYIGLLGVVLALGLIVPPAGWELGIPALRLLGGGLLALLLGYLLLCAFSRRRYWTIRGHEVYLPSLGMGLLQVALGASNWALMALVLDILLPAQFGYPAVLGALLISAFAGVITHIPAGLGVMEVVFIALLQQQASIGVLLAGLIGYRVVYYLLPLALAGLGYALLEMRAKRMRQSNRRKQAALDKP
ncbi:MAG: lysylphosphatidylglycerol synthase domain-containing protein [Pseudomonas sp.]|uniref:lysylphosphatidylglycerol synthase domain-containing protein n=1 Tax=Pseudomonas sp. TaxID=306 RepID=UPI00299E9A50|nr:lysylphosphatidylglycerol synthase domain-containing protein [Pseudomonas sp.]MDX1726045.1 lysylphosphatidylglycerol synthase domain-containing protein [Pseudomonas sp.]